jgi:acyl-CoA thioesterase-1
MVMCRATDEASRASSCAFTVTVTPPPRPPRISATRFVAFGDSITEGVISLAPYALIPSPPQSYPFKLLNRLVARYSDQTSAIQVLDEGVGGEGVARGLTRLPGVLAADRPEVLLLMEGVNDLNGVGAPAIRTVVDALRSMVRVARGRGVQVFVATLLPQRAGAQRAYSVALIDPINAQIRAMASDEGAVLVDLYQGFGASADPWIGADGLHPTEAGMDRVAEIFFEALRERLEVSAATMFRLRR